MPCFQSINVLAEPCPQHGSGSRGGGHGPEQGNPQHSHPQQRIAPGQARAKRVAQEDLAAGIGVMMLAYAVVKHRLMDVELIVRRALGFVLAVAVLVGVALLTAGLTDVLWEEPHNAVIALLSALVAVLLFTPVKSRVQEVLERLVERERTRNVRVTEFVPRERTEEVRVTDEDEYFPPPRELRDLIAAIGHFAGIGLEDELPEPAGGVAQPATFEK